MAVVSDKDKFNQALKQEDCDVVDAMLAEGYVPEPDCIKIVCKNGNITLLQALLHSGKYDMNVQLGLFVAVKYKQTHLLNYLYLAGADVNLPDAKGRTLLYKANDAETCKWLLDMGAQQVTSYRKQSPLYMACFRGNEDVVKLLLSSKQGIQFITQVDRWGHTPLYDACLFRRVGIVKLLLSYEQGVQTIAQPNGWGNTPLHIACHNHDIDTVKLLLSYEQGVKTINQPDKFKITPLDDAKSYPEILALLNEALSKQ